MDRNIEVISKMILYTGGATGSDKVWYELARKYGHEQKVYSFKGHETYVKDKDKIDLTDRELEIGFAFVLKVRESMNRDIGSINPYVRKLLSRDYYIIKYSQAVYAVGKIKNNIVDGGTGWGVAMGIYFREPIFVMDKDTLQWSAYNYGLKSFVPYKLPKLIENYAGIGSREINMDKIRGALELVYKSD